MDLISSNSHFSIFTVTINWTYNCASTLLYSGGTKFVSTSSCSTLLFRFVLYYCLIVSLTLSEQVRLLKLLSVVNKLKFSLFLLAERIMLYRIYISMPYKNFIFAISFEPMHTKSVLRKCVCAAYYLSCKQ